jgi:hypothetical protein
MGSTSKKGRATINPSDPRALGVCDRCGALYNLHVLRYQFQWAGTAMVNKQLRVCPTCYDTPSEFLRTIILPPDPPPVWQPRPEPYLVDEVNDIWLRPVGIGTQMFSAVSAMQALFSFALGMLPALTGASDMAATLRFGVGMLPTIDGASDLAATTLLGRGLSAAIDGVSDLAATLTQVVPPAGASLTWTDSDLTYASASPYTITGAAIGTADANRLVIVGLCGFKSLLGDQITAVTIGGISAKRIALVNGGVGSVGVYPFADLWWANVPTGTTANIVITYADTGMGLLTEVYAGYGINTTNPSWDAAFNVAQSGSVSATINMPDDSASMGAAYTGLNSVPTTSSWTNLTEDSDVSADPGVGVAVSGGAASRIDATSAGNVAVSANAASADTNPIKSLVCSSFTADDGNIWAVVTAGSSWSVPADWNSADNSIHAIGSSANATDPGAVGGGGTGGGAWARTDNLTLTPSGSATIQIGSNGTDTWLSNTGVTPTSTSEGVLAKGGTTNSGITAGNGGASGSCIGTAANSGGNGGAGQNALNGYGGGGGGAGGPNGAGAVGAAAAAGTAGGGGGGANGGTAGSSGTGGSSRLNVPGGTTNGDPGGFGSGGAGKTGTSTAVTAAGSQEPIWIDKATGNLAGPGAGGGGGRGGTTSTAAATGGQGGLYGGGAGGSGEDATAHAAGRNGVLVIRYRP